MSGLSGFFSDLLSCACIPPKPSAFPAFRHILLLVPFPLLLEARADRSLWTRLDALSTADALAMVRCFPRLHAHPASPAAGPAPIAFGRVDPQTIERHPVEETVYGPQRAYILAKRRAPLTHDIHRQQRQKDHEYQQNHTLNIPQPAWIRRRSRLANANALQADARYASYSGLQLGGKGFHEKMQESICEFVLHMTAWGSAP